MMISLCHLLLHPLILWFCCHCLAASHGKLDASNQHNIYKTNPRFKAMRSDLKVNFERSKDHFQTLNSNRAGLCPSPAAISPCTCATSLVEQTFFDCTYAKSVDQLMEVFQQDFPVKELYEFAMMDNSAINLFPSFMNGITFERIFLYPGPFILEAISDHFLLDLKDTLKYFDILDSKLTTDFFPFSMLPSMNQLLHLGIFDSDINWLPEIQAPNLTAFYLAYSPLELLVNGTFPIGTGPMLISFEGSQIHTIEAGSFFFADQNSADSNEQIIFYLYKNRLQSLKAGTFPLRNGPLEISLPYNQISSIEPGTFVLPASTDLLALALDLSYNELTTFDEAVFGSLMPFIRDLALDANPLICGCDIAWLIVNEGFMATLNFASCANGTYLFELDPQQYIDSC